MEDTPRHSVALRGRNWLAVTGLWTALLAWLVVAGTIVWIGTRGGEPTEAIGWTVLGIEVAALIQSVIGITWIRSRGDTAVAIAALVLTLALPGFASSLFFFGFGAGID